MIKSFSDPWLPTKAGFKLELVQGTNVEHELRVCDLMQSNRTWNAEVIRPTSTPTDVAHIMQTRIPPEGPPDRLLSPYTDDGEVTAKSVYHRLREEEEGWQVDLNRPARSRHTIWNNVWKTTMILKVKNYH